MEENDRLQKQVSQLVYENSYFRQQTQNVRELLHLFSFLSLLLLSEADTVKLQETELFSF